MSATKQLGEACARTLLPQCVVAVTGDFYWGKGEDLEAAIAVRYAQQFYFGA